jgi:Tfp pilus assembly protein PilN
MRVFVSLIAWLAVRAGADVGQPRHRYGSVAVANAIPGGAILSQALSPNRAGRLVPVPEEALPEKSLVSHWALWAAVVLIVLVLAAGYLRRRWKAAGRPRAARLLLAVRSRYSGRK